MGDNSYAVVSFFSGAMGMDIGLEQAGLDVRVAQEIDKKAAETIKLNNHTVLEGDINEILEKDANLSQLKELGNLSANEEVFAVVGGPPCQSFSTMGKRLGINDKRGNLIFSYINAINIIQPRFAVLENVRGVLSTAGVKNDRIINDIVEAFNEIGYHVKWELVDAVNYGAAQFRERLIIIASRDKEDTFIPIPTNFQLHQSADYRWRTVRDAIINNSIDKHDYVQFSPKVLEVFHSVPPEMNWRGLPDEIASVVLGAAYNSGKGGNSGFYRRLKLDEPSPTLVTSPLQKSTMLAHPFEHRPLSVQEYARIQGFPDDWHFAGSLSQIYKQIGNAVPVPLGYAIGAMLKSVAKGNSKIITKRKK